jgi:sporulation protein YlmC with PRC-barrel domain
MSRSLEEAMSLVNLSRSAPTQLPDGAYDVRGWEVRTELDGEKVGKVDDMLVDERDNPRYLEVDLGIFRRHVLLPLSVAHADPSAQIVWIDQLDKERIREIPEYDRDLGRLTPEYEDRLVREYRLLSERRDGEEPLNREVEQAGLARLSDLGDYRVAKGVTDPRGWKVVGGDGGDIGEVKELIVDATAMTTRYLDIEVHEDRLELEPLNRHILIPADRVRLDRSGKNVVIDGVFGRDITDYPMYQGLPLDRQAQRAIDDVFDRPREARSSESAAGRFFGVRSRAAGGTTSAPVRSRGRPDVDESGRDVERVVSDTRRETITDADNVRIRISGDDIIIERHPRGGRDDG